MLDTVARLQAYQPDAYLKSKLDRWIPIIARIQLEDGLVDSWTVLGEFDATHGKPWRWQIKKGDGDGFHGALHYNTGSLYAFASTLQRATGDGRALAIADRAVRRFMERSNTVAGPMQWAVPISTPAPATPAFSTRCAALVGPELRLWPPGAPRGGDLRP